MRFKPETTAWIVTSVAFFVFCLLCAAAILGGNWYLRSATESRPALLTTIAGTITVWDTNKNPSDSNKTSWVALREPEARLEEGIVISTDRNSRALLTLFDNSTIEMFNDSQLKLTEMRVSRFDLLQPKANRIQLQLISGKIRLGVAPPYSASTDFLLGVPQATLSLDEGSFLIDASQDKSSLRVRERGTARVMAMGQTRVLHEQDRVDIAAGQPPSDLLPSAQELVENGDFQAGLKGWSFDLERNIGLRPGPGGPGQITLFTSADEHAVRFSRVNSEGAHAEPTISQQIKKDVAGFNSLQLSLRLNVLDQSLSGGGYMGSEYPLQVKLIYTTEEGSEAIYVRGFYCQNTDQNSTANGTIVPQGKWIEWKSPENLMAIQPPPRTLKTIEITASGWDFDSMLSKISLVAD